MSRIQMLLRNIIMPLNMIWVARICHPRSLIEVTDKTPKIGILVDMFLIALKVTVIDEIKSKQSSEQADVS